jgi:hypothetical protein
MIEYVIQENSRVTAADEQVVPKRHEIAAASKKGAVGPERKLSAFVEYDVAPPFRIHVILENDERVIVVHEVNLVVLHERCPVLFDPVVWHASDTQSDRFEFVKGRQGDTPILSFVRRQTDERDVLPAVALKQPRILRLNLKALETIRVEHKSVSTMHIYALA